MPLTIKDIQNTAPETSLSDLGKPPDAGDFEVSPDPSVDANEPVWDYKTSKTGMKGEVPLAYKLGDWELKPQGFDPNGDVYFGGGFMGWAKKYAYKTLAVQWDSTNSLEASEAKVTEGWNKLKDANWGKAALDVSALGGAVKTVQGITGEEDKTGEGAGEVLSGAWDIISGIWGTAESLDQSKNKAVKTLGVPVSAATKFVSAAVEAGLDVLGEFAKKAQQVIGLDKTMREYVRENGMPTAELVDFDPITIYKEYQLTDELVNTFLNNIAVPLKIYDAVQFFQAPGTTQEKMNALELGWTENRMLWTELVKPAVEAEFERRMLEPGADPNLLQMELQDPWAQLLGEIAIDPLNLTSAFAKGAKQAGNISKAMRQGGMADEMVDGLKVMSEASTEPRAAELANNLAKKVADVGWAEKEGGGFVRKIMPKLGFTMNALDADGKVVQQTKNMSEFMTWATSSIYKMKGSPDDLGEVLSAMYKIAAPPDKIEEIKHGMAILNGNKKIVAPHVFFSQQGMETAHMLRNLIDDGMGGDVENWITALKKATPEKQAEMFKTLIHKAAKAQYPSVTEMSQAAKRVKEGSTKALDIAHADEYARLAKERPEIVAVAKLDNELYKPVGKINAHLNNIYFSTAGYGVRNAISAQFHLFADMGAGAYIKSRLTMSNADIEKKLLDIFHGQLPESLLQKGFVDSLKDTDDIFATIAKKYKALPISGQSIAARTEYNAGLRVFYKFYQDTMESMVDFGTGLLSKEEWAAKGFTPSQAEHYKTILAANNHDVIKAREIFVKQHVNGMIEARKTLEWVPPNVVRTIKEYDQGGAWNKFVELVGKEETTKEDIARFLDDLGNEIRGTAFQRTKQVQGIPMKDAPEFEAMFGGNYEELKGFKEKQMHIWNADQATIEAWQDDMAKATSIADNKRKQLQQIRMTATKPNPENDLLENALSDWLRKAQVHTEQALFMRSNYTDELKKSKAYLDNWMEEVNPLSGKKNKFHYAYNEGEKGVKWKAWYKKVDDEHRAYFEFYNGAGSRLAEDFANLTGEDQFKAFKKAFTARDSAAAAGTVIADPKTGRLFEDVPASLKYTDALGTKAHEDMLYKLADWYAGHSTSSKNMSSKNMTNGRLDLMTFVHRRLPEIDPALANRIVVEFGEDWGMNAVPMETFEKLIAERYTGGEVFGTTDFLKGRGLNAERRAVTAPVVEDRRLPAHQRITDNWANLSDEAKQQAVKNSLIDAPTGLENRLAFELEGKTAPEGWTTVNIDANGLKYVNDTWGHGAGDELIKGIGDAIQRGIKEVLGEGKARAFHPSGDEFALWIENEADAKRVSEYIDKTFSETILTFTDTKGVDHAKKGFSVSYGTGRTADEAETALGIDKERRVAIGQRAPRGELAPSIVDVGKEAQPNAQIGSVPTKGKKPVAPIRTQAMENMPSAPDVAAATKDDMLKALKFLEDGTSKRFGMMNPDRMSDAQFAALDEFEKQVTQNVEVAKLTAQRVGHAARDFALGAYGETTNLNRAGGYVLPYNFFYTFTYKNWAKRIGTSADTLAGYAKFKDFMANEYKNQPEWYKYNVKIPDFMGINKGNPYMINLEASIWPLQGITGVDFNDPEKRTNWFTAMVDDLGKFGPTTWAPISWTIAAYYHKKGQDEFAAKWGTRAIPFTSTIKAASSYFGAPIELDPNVQFFSGEGLGDINADDPFEEGRVSRALSAMEAEGVPKEQLIEAARTHSGELWDEARQRAAQDRAPSQIASSFLGVGFKGRKESDIITDNFYADFHRMRTMHENKLMSDDQYKAGFDKLREAYPFMDVILLSRKAGMGRENAYAWNVINRIPPGMMPQVAEAAGLNYETIQKFYDTAGGSIADMNETEKVRFINGMVDIGAMLAIPKAATKAEWNAAQSTKKEMYKILESQFGKDAVEKMSLFNGISEKADKKLFLELNPEVEAVLDMKQEMVVSNPLLMKYYGGVETLDMYYSSQMYDKLEAKFGKEVLDAERKFHASTTTEAEKKELAKKYKLYDYWDAKAILKDEALRAVVEFGSKLPDPPAPEIRSDLPAELNSNQQDLAALGTPEPQITFEQYSGIIGEEMTDHVLSYWQEGKELTSWDKKDLEYIARANGFYNGDDLLQAILISLQGAK